MVWTVSQARHRMKLQALPAESEASDIVLVGCGLPFNRSGTLIVTTITYEQRNSRLCTGPMMRGPTSASTLSLRSLLLRRALGVEGLSVEQLCPPSEDWQGLLQGTELLTCAYLSSYWTSTAGG